jgi:hypothetical protein
MTPRVRSAALLAVALGLSAAAGCGPAEPKPVPVSGTVTLDGQPLADGFVYFKSPQTGGLERFEIAGGAFQGMALPGTRRVEVISNRPKSVVIDGAKVDVPDNIIDPKFNLDSGLTADVTPGGPNTFTFEVKRKK